MSNRASASAWLSRALIQRWASHLQSGGFFVEEGGRVATFGAPARSAPRVVIHNARFYTRVATRGEVGLGEAYVAGDWDCDDLPALLSLGLRSAMGGEINGRASALARALFRAHHARRANSHARSPQNVQDHFDAGNRLFELMLGPTMLYTCALFDGADEGLAAAELRKYEAVARKLQARPGDHILDLGCGFGGLAIFLAEEAGCRVTGISLSLAQLRLARERVTARGLDDAISLRYCDYRDVTGSYDGVAVIGMLENVGQEFLSLCMRKCSELLAPPRRMAVDVMVTPDRLYRAGHEGDSWLQQYVFPGGSTPSTGSLAAALEGTRLLQLDAQDIGLEYARTCHAWAANFAAHEADVRLLGFDEAFIRTWRYWLAIGEAAFNERRLSAMLATYERLPGPP